MRPRPEKTRSLAAREQPVALDIPEWNPREHALHFRGLVVKHFSHEALNQELLLSAFEVACWPLTIEFHFAPKVGASAKVRLRETINNLNRSVAPHLHFFQEGNGRRIGWRPSRKRRAT